MMMSDDDDEIQVFKRVAISKIFETLRTIGTLINTTNVTEDTISNLKECCTLYFNLYSLVFPEVCNSTVWTLGYVIPFHGQRLYEDYNVGFGILSMRGRIQNTQK